MQQTEPSVHLPGEEEHLEPAEGKQGEPEAHAGVDEHLQLTQWDGELVQGSADKNPAGAAAPGCSPL